MSYTSLSTQRRVIASTTILHRTLLQTGIWPSRTTGPNLKTKFDRYKGNTSLYMKKALQRRPYYATEYQSRVQIHQVSQ